VFGKLSERTRKRLLEHGTRAPATVLEVGERGMTISHGDLVADTEIVLKVRLRVEPPAQVAFEVERRLRFEQFSLPQVGGQIAVIFDADDHDTLMLDPDAVAPIVAEAAQLATRARELADSTAATREQIHQMLAAKGMPGSAGSAETRDMIRQMLAAKGVSGPGGAAPAAPDPVAELERLGALRERGLLTDEEFAAAKARVLGS
jgi:hypothetical protein